MSGDVLVPELSAFEQIKHRDDEGYEFWYARELMKLLGYKLWQNFERVIEEAMAVVGQEGPDAVATNFIASNKNNSGETRGRKGTDYILTRHACYVIAESADGRKDEVAWAKIYFAYTTERYELLAQTEEDAIRIEERQKLLLKNAELQMRVRMAGGITPRHFATFVNRGYQGLYNGETAEDIRIRNGLPSKADILDWMGGVERAANGMRAALTLHHLTERDVKTLPEANETHYGVGTRVRAFLASEGIYPEQLPTPKKSYQQLLREQAFRERLAAEDKSGLWGLLEAGDDEGED
ncbi:MAG: DNA damage-inducible protein D [Ktedonobacterales bacterium]